MDHNGITRGAIESIFNSSSASNHPVVQVIDLKKIAGQANANAQPRFRLAISDGTHFQQAMMATQLNSLIIENKLKVNCLIRLNEIIVNTVQVKRIVIILNVDVVNTLPEKIGSPLSIDAVMSKGGPAITAIQGVAPNAPPAANPPQPHAMQKPPMQNGYNPQMQQQQQQQQHSSPIAQNNTNNNMNSNGMGANGHTTGNGFGNQNGGGFGNSNGNGWHAPNPFSNKGGPANVGSTAIAKQHSSPGSAYRPISSINPYQNGWTIRGRCTYKGELRTYQNARGEGQVTSFELTDESGSIRITGFQQQAQRINDIVHMNHIYKVAGGYLKQANEKYNRSTSNFEMTLDPNSTMDEVTDDGSFMQIKYNFTQIANLESIDVKGSCDVVGIVTSVGPLSEITLRSTGEQCPKRSLSISDDSNASVELTLWRKQAESFITEEAAVRAPVLVIRNAMRGDFGGVSLNVSRATTLELDPVNVPEANKLRAWYDNGGGAAANIVSVTSGSGGASGANNKVTGPRKSLVEARIEDVEPAFAEGGDGNASAMFTTRGMLTFVNTKNDLYYPGDPDTKKKVIQQGGGLWSSESSGRQLSDDEIVWRYLVSMKIADHSSSHWVSAFDEIGPVLFGRPAKELRNLKESDLTLYEHIVEDALCRPMLFKIQVKERTWRDQRQIRYTISRAEQIDFASETRKILDEIKEYI